MGTGLVHRVSPRGGARRPRAGTLGSSRVRLKTSRNGCHHRAAGKVIITLTELSYEHHGPHHARTEHCAQLAYQTTHCCWVGNLRLDDASEERLKLYLRSAAGSFARNLCARGRTERTRRIYQPPGLASVALLCLSAPRLSIRATKTLEGIKHLGKVGVNL
eukprot:COSAG02_NODE_1275_length_13506_cov_8.845603_17_plen_161_part_00